MAPKFGNYLFRNLKNQEAGEPNPVPPAEPNAPKLDDRIICLTENDFVTDEAFVPALAWEQCPGRRVEVKLSDTSGLMNGRVTIQAGVLRRVAGPLVPPEVPDEFQLPISLRTVVLQIQPFLQQPSNQGSMRPAGPDFDTPIAQVAREDEGFFKLENTSDTDGKLPVEPPGSAVAPVTPLPSFPLIREKPLPERPASPEPGPAALPVNVVRPQGRGARSDDADRYDPFAVLPPVGPRPLSGEAPASAPPSPPVPDHHVHAGGTPPEAGQSSRPETLPSERTPPKVLRRAALERLQEIFMTDDLLDFGEVLRLVGRFPRVMLAFAVTKGGAVYGDAPPLGVNAALAPGLTEAARRFARLAAGAECQGLTLLGERPLSIVGNENLCLVLLHEGRALPPGMKERVGAIARALADLLPPPSDE